MGEWSQVHLGCRCLPVSTRLGVLWSPHYLVMQLTGSENSEASLKPQITHLVLNLPQANTGITGEIQKRVYLTCNLKELPVLEPAQANTLLHKPNLTLFSRQVCQEVAEVQNSNCLQAMGPEVRPKANSCSRALTTALRDPLQSLN